MYGHWAPLRPDTDGAVKETEGDANSDRVQAPIAIPDTGGKGPDHGPALPSPMLDPVDYGGRKIKDVRRELEAKGYTVRVERSRFGHTGVSWIEQSKADPWSVVILWSPCSPAEGCPKTFDYELVTHCGIRWAYFDGRRWITPFRRDLPEGWEQPVQAGQMEVLSHDLAVFTSEGHELTFRPSKGPKPASF